MGNGRASRTQGGFDGETRGSKMVETGFLREWRPAASGVETGCFQVKKDAPCRWSAFIGVALSSDLRAFGIQTVRGFSCTGVAFRFLSGLLKIKNSERPLYSYCCFWWDASRLCCRPRVGPGESSASVALAWVAPFWGVAFVCGPQLVSLQRT